MLPESKSKPHSASFTSLQISESFQHFRSASYFEAVHDVCSEKPRPPRMPSISTPCTPKKIEIEKYSTLPVLTTPAFPGKKARSSSLSSFFRKLRPRFHRSSSDGKNPWIVIEFAPHGDDDGSSGSDQSIELAVKSKARHFSSLKDICGIDPCNCPLRKDSVTSPPKCTRDSSRKPSKYKSEGSIFFKLSPRRRLENLKHVLKSLSKKRGKFRSSSSMHSLGSRTCAYKSESCLKTDHGFSSGAFSSFSQIENDRASPVFRFCQSKHDALKSLRHSADVSYLFKLPNSRSSNASLSSVLEDSTATKRAQPPRTLGLPSKSFQDQSVLRIYQKMASVESIGACSLDFEVSAADNFAARDLTASECTLLSGAASSVQEGKNGEHAQDMSTPDDKPRLLNGSSEKRECTIAEIKLPSYVSISCAINGYTNYSRFCRSRESSPARPSRKASLPPINSAMLPDSGSHRYGRSRSDCPVYTESARVTVSKQIQVPLSRQYITEVTIPNGTSNGHVNEPCTNGHATKERLVLAKEVNSDATKSLVQQRIESLYGKSASEEIKVSFKTVSKTKEVSGNGTENSINASSPTVNGKNHIGSVSPPVFRHLNKDFRKQLQVNIPKKSDAQKVAKPCKPTSNLEKELSSKVDSALLISNGISHDECDRVKSLTPPPVKSSFGELAKAQPADGEQDGYRFLSLIDAEKERIQVQIAKLETQMQEEGIPEEAMGRMRAASGKANLLITQKFEQFRGLCWKNIEENPSVPFYTTASDLAGFWDLVLLQVEDIHSTFKDIEAMKSNNWEEVVPEKPLVPVTSRTRPTNGVSKSNPSTPRRSAKSAELSRAREEARRQLLAAKKRGRSQSAQQDEVAIFVPASS